MVQNIPQLENSMKFKKGLEKKKKTSQKRPYSFMYSQYPLCWISKKSILLSPFFMHLFAFFAGVSHLLAHLWRLRFRHRNCPLVFYLRERNHFRPTTFSVQLSTRFIALLSSRGLLQFGRIWQNWRYTILNCTFF